MHHIDSHLKGDGSDHDGEDGTDGDSSLGAGTLVSLGCDWGGLAGLGWRVARWAGTALGTVVGLATTGLGVSLWSTAW
jgi:hypothetical protein